MYLVASVAAACPATSASDVTIGAAWNGRAAGRFGICPGMLRSRGAAEESDHLGIFGAASSMIICRSGALLLPLLLHSLL